jgi:hypothetical protein
VLAGLTLELVHDLLQAAMGWDDYHLHEFRVGQRRFGKPDPDDQLMGLPEVSNERSVHLFEILGKAGAGLEGEAVFFGPAAQCPFEGTKNGELGVLLHVVVNALTRNAHGAGQFALAANHLVILDRLATLAFPKLTGKVSGKVAGFGELWRL